MVYYFSKKLGIPFGEAVARVTDKLKENGFGILTEIDVKETLKKKLDVEFRPYKILGACNPPFAYQALQAEEKIGLMLKILIYSIIVSNIKTQHTRKE